MTPDPQPPSPPKPQGAKAAKSRRGFGGEGGMKRQTIPTNLAFRQLAAHGPDCTATMWWPLGSAPIVWRNYAGSSRGHKPWLHMQCNNPTCPARAIAGLDFLSSLPMGSTGKRGKP